MNLHVDNLLVRQYSFKALRFTDAESELSWTRVCREDGDDAGREGDHHVPGQLHLAPRLVRPPEVAVDNLVEGDGQGDGVRHADGERRRPSGGAHGDAGGAELQAGGAVRAGHGQRAGPRTDAAAARNGIAPTGRGPRDGDPAGSAGARRAALALLRRQSWLTFDVADELADI